MSSFTHRLAKSAPFARSTAIAALLSATMLAGLPLAARADGAANPVIRLAQASAPQRQDAAETKGETVEQRITGLHAALKITAAQDSQLFQQDIRELYKVCELLDKLADKYRKSISPQSSSYVTNIQHFDARERSARPPA